MLISNLAKCLFLYVICSLTLVTITLTSVTLSDGILINGLLFMASLKLSKYNINYTSMKLNL